MSFASAINKVNFGKKLYIFVLKPQNDIWKESEGVVRNSFGKSYTFFNKLNSNNDIFPKKL